MLRCDHRPLLRMGCGVWKAHFAGTLPCIMPHAVPCAARPRSRGGPGADVADANVGLPRPAADVQVQLAKSDKKSGASAGPVPFRQSKLTSLLKESVSGNSRTDVLLCVCADAASYENTVSPVPAQMWQA